MGLLDDLKREADQVREAREAEAARRAGRDKIYRTELAPRLTGIYRYLMEMIEHLETVEWVVEAAYDIPGAGRIGNLHQEHYRLHIDSHDSPRKVTLQFICKAKEERKFPLPAEKAGEFREFLTIHQVMFSEWPFRDGQGQISGTVFQVRLRVRAGLVFEADVASSRIRVVSHNFEDLAPREYLFGYAAIDEDWLDDLGHFLLRRKNVLGGKPLSEEERERLRRFVAEQKKTERYLDIPPGPVHEEARKNPGKSGIFRVLRNRLFGSEP